MQNGKNLLHLYSTAMLCSHATGTQSVPNSCARHFLAKKYLQKIELSYRTVTSTSTEHLKFKATLVDNTGPNAYTILSSPPLPKFTQWVWFFLKKPKYCSDERSGFPPFPRTHAETRPLVQTCSTRCSRRQQHKLPHAEPPSAPEPRPAQHFTHCMCLPCWDTLGTLQTFSPIFRKL